MRILNCMYILLSRWCTSKFLRESNLVAAFHSSWWTEGEKYSSLLWYAGIRSTSKLASHWNTLLSAWNCTSSGFWWSPCIRGLFQTCLHLSLLALLKLVIAFREDFLACLCCSHFWKDTFYPVGYGSEGPCSRGWWCVPTLLQTVQQLGCW